MDHVLTNINDRNVDTSPIVSDVSDHSLFHPFKNFRKEVLPPKKVRVMKLQTSR